MAEQIIRLRRAAFTPPRGSKVLHDAELDLSAGETVAIVGRSGSGKSTLLAGLGLVSPFDRGVEYSLADTDVTKLSDRQASQFRSQRIGFVLQNSGLIAHLTAAENVALPLMHAKHQTGKSMKRAVAEALDLLEVGHLAKRRPSRVSGGERQRIAIARALVTQPSLILADEPTGALDEATGQLVLDQMLGLVHQFGAALIVVTHDTAVATQMHSTLRMVAGRLMREGVDR